MVAQDVYELVEDHFGEPVSPELAMRVRAGTREGAFDFADRYRTSPHSGYAPLVPVYLEDDPPGVGTYSQRGRYALSDRQFAQVREQVGSELTALAQASLVAQHSADDITDVWREEREKDVLKHALGLIVVGARVSERIGDVDVYLRSTFQQRALTAALDAAPDWLTGASPPPSAHRRRELEVLGRLLALDLPDLSSLTPGDVLAMRRNDQTFDRWRLALRSGLSAVDLVADDPLTAHADKVRREVADEIRAAGLGIEADINRSDVLSAGKSGLVSFAVGLITTSILAGPFAPAHLAEKALGAAGSALAASGARKMRQRTFATAVRRHTVLFET